MKTTRWCPALLSLALLAGGCATTGAAPRTEAAADDDRRVQMEALVVRAEPDPLTGLADYDAQALLELADERFRAEAYDQAAKIYEKLLAEFPDASVVPLARYNAGLAYEKLEEWPKAAEQFEALVQRHRGAEPWLDAHFNLARAYGKLERWAGVADTFWAARQVEGGLEPMPELEARVGTGVGLFMQGDHATAEREFQQAIRFYEGHPQKAVLPAPYFVAQARFYLAEIAAREFEAVALVAPIPGKSEAEWTERMGKELEAKCQLLLRAQSGFIKTIRVGHRGWATAAGFRIGSLYERLFDELTAVPVPPELDASAAEIYREELRQKVGVLVKKAIQVYEMNREMAERIGERNEWVERTTAALERMKKLYLSTAAS